MHNVFRDRRIARCWIRRPRDSDLVELGRRRHGQDCDSVVTVVDPADDAVVEPDALPAVDGDGDDDNERCHASDTDGAGNEEY